MQCPICDSQALAPLYQLQGHRIDRCGNCRILVNGTFFQEPSFREKLFEETYYDGVQSEAFKNKLDAYQNDPSLPFYTKYLSWIESQRGKGRVLDVGCAFGNFLKMAQDRGWDPSGVEISKYSSKLAHDKWGFPVFNGNLLDSSYKDSSFDLVTFWDVIEHVGNPVQNLKKAHALLKPGGWLLITTDSYQSLMSLIAKSLYQVSFRKIRYGMEKFYIKHNSFYFTPTDLKKLMARAGFKLVRTEGVDYPIDKMNLSPAEKLLVRVLYGAGQLTRLNSQILVIAEKQ
jgi:2-polyprenyl-3-methyl-5-hydroxy-6-metoxy-1,4-benzoquinol methylase